MLPLRAETRSRRPPAAWVQLDATASLARHRYLGVLRHKHRLVCERERHGVYSFDALHDTRRQTHANANANQDGCAFPSSRVTDCLWAVACCR